MFHVLLTYPIFTKKVLCHRCNILRADSAILPTVNSVAFK